MFNLVECVRRAAQAPDLLRRLKWLYTKRDPREVVDWANGGCYVFALALLHVFGGELVYVWITPEDAEDFTNHVGVLIPSMPEAALDADGFTPLAVWGRRYRFFEEWEDGYEIRRGTPPDHRSLLSDKRLVRAVENHLRAC